MQHGSRRNWAASHFLHAVLTALASMPTPVQAQTPKASPAAATAPFTLSAVPRGTARIVFFREKRFKGGGSGPYINVGTMEFDRLKNGTFYRVEVPPGSYEISCDSDQFVFDILDVDLEEGQTLFIAPWFRPGVMAADWAPKIIRERLASKYLKDIQEVPAVRLK